MLGAIAPEPAPDEPSAVLHLCRPNAVLAVRRFTMPPVIRLALGTVVGGVVAVVGLDVVGSNRYGVLAVAIVSMLVIGYIARDPFGTGDWPLRRG
jgi:hypothetical protein